MGRYKLAVELYFDTDMPFDVVEEIDAIDYVRDALDCYSQIDKTCKYYKVSSSKKLTIHNSTMVPCCQCGESVEINRKKYSCQSCFDKLTSAQHQ